MEVFRHDTSVSSNTYCTDIEFNRQRLPASGSASLPPAAGCSSSSSIVKDYSLRPGAASSFYRLFLVGYQMCNGGSVVTVPAAAQSATKVRQRLEFFEEVLCCCRKALVGRS